MSQSAKTLQIADDDATSRYHEALAHSEKLLEAQPSESERSAWRKWAKEFVNYETKTLIPSERRAPRAAKIADGVGNRLMSVMKAVEVADARLRNGDAGPTSSGESESEEASPRRLRHLLKKTVEVVVPTIQAAEAEIWRKSDVGEGVCASNAMRRVSIVSDAPGKTINYEVPCMRCAKAGIACAGKEGRACFTCKANRQGCELSSRARRLAEEAEGTVAEKLTSGSGSKAGSSQPAKGKEKEKEEERSEEKGNDRTAALAKETEAATGRMALRSRERRVRHEDVSEPEHVSRTGPSTSRKRRAAEANISQEINPSKKVNIGRPQRREAGQSGDRDVDWEEVRDAFVVCDAAFRQLRKALRL